MLMNVGRDTDSEGLSENVAAQRKAEMLRESLATAREAHSAAEAKMIEHYNKKRAEMHFSVGDEVLLAAKNIRTLRTSKKLADQFLGPFRVVEKYGANAYKLNLPEKYGKLHHTFHVSLLQAYRARPGVKPPEPVDIEGDEEWEVTEVLDERNRRGQREYHVRWKGFSEAYDSWEPARHLRHVGEAVEAFKQKKKRNKKEN